jgi:histidine transport system permease protein
MTGARHDAVAAGDLLRIGFCLALPLAIARNARNPLALGAGLALYLRVSRHAALCAAADHLYGVLQPGFCAHHVVLADFFKQGLNCTHAGLRPEYRRLYDRDFAGAIRETNFGEVDAARSLGMSRFTMYRRIIIPSALRRALPVYSNEVILMLHATTLAFTATVPDILKVANDAYSATYNPFASFTTAALIYPAFPSR